MNGDRTVDTGDTSTDLGTSDTDMGEGVPDTDMGEEPSINPDANEIPNQSSDDTPLTDHHKPGTTPENSPEYPPCPETEPISIPPEQETPGFPEGEGGPPKPPEGWTPGGPESGW